MNLIKLFGKIKEYSSNANIVHFEIYVFITRLRPKVFSLGNMSDNGRDGILRECRELGRRRNLNWKIVEGFVEVPTYL